MKKKSKIVMGLTVLFIAAGFFNKVMAETESGGGDSAINCYKPDTNTCAIIHTNGIQIKLKGVLYID